MAAADTGPASAAPARGAPASLSIVVPVYNEEEVLPEFHRRLTAVLDGIPGAAEIVYVNDGSRDGSRRCWRSCAAAMRGSPSSTCRATSARKWR